MNVLKKIFAVESLVPQSKRLGELPTSKSAYMDMLRIATPSVLEMVLVSLVGAIDTMMVGTLGPQAIAAVGLVGQPRMLLLCMFFALNIGVTAVVARRKGEGRQEDGNHTLRCGLLIVLALSLVITLVVVPLAHPLMILAGAQTDTVDLAAEYFSIISYVLPLQAATLCINAAQRGVGNTRVTMNVNLLSNGINIVLNWLLINGNLGFPALGVRGAALATMIGLVAGFFLSLYSVVCHKSTERFLHLSLKQNWRLKKEPIQAILKVGGNAMLEQVALRIGFFTYARLVAGLGTLAFAAHQVCMQFLSISFNFADGLGVAGTSLVGQMLGKKRADLSMMYGKISQRLALCVALILASVIVVLRRPLVSLFTTDPQTLLMAIDVMLMVALFQPFQTSSVVISGCLRGAGDTRYVAGVMLLCVAVIRPVLAYVSIYVLGFGLVGAWASSLIDMIVRLACVYHRFSGGKWYTIKV